MDRGPKVAIFLADHDVLGSQLDLLFACMGAEVETDDPGPIGPRPRRADLDLAPFGLVIELRGQGADTRLDVGEPDLGDLGCRP